MKLRFIPNEVAAVFATVDGNNPPAPADFYRFTPTAGMSDREITDVRNYLESLKEGAVVKVLPRERKKRTIAKAKAKKAKSKTPRETVNELVEVSTSTNKVALKEECQMRMDECKV